VCLRIGVIASDLRVLAVAKVGERAALSHQRVRQRARTALRGRKWWTPTPPLSGRIFGANWREPALLEPAALINKCRQGAHAAADAGRTAKERERERGGEYLNSGGDSCESERWREAPPITGRSRKTRARPHKSHGARCASHAQSDHRVYREARAAQVWEIFFEIYQTRIARSEWFCLLNCLNLLYYHLLRANFAKYTVGIDSIHLAKYVLSLNYFLFCFWFSIWSCAIYYWIKHNIVAAKKYIYVAIWNWIWYLVANCVCIYEIIGQCLSICI